MLILQILLIGAWLDKPPGPPIEANACAEAPDEPVCRPVQIEYG